MIKFRSVGHKVPVLDQELGGTEDLRNTSIDVTNDGVVCGFVRKLVTGDPHDVKLELN